VRTRVTAIVAVGAAVLAVVGAGCSEEDLRVGSEESELCAATDRVDDAADALDELDADTATPEERNAAQERLLDAVADVAEEAADVAEARADAGEDPIGEFNARVQAIPNDASPGEIASEMARAAGDFLADAQDFFRSPGCAL
jgi:hypothetical protein